MADTQPAPDPKVREIAQGAFLQALLSDLDATQLLAKVESLTAENAALTAQVAKLKAAIHLANHAERLMLRAGPWL